jgi:hypothetical protein
VDNINAASDRVLQLTDRLELPKLLRHTPGRSHTSPEGVLPLFVEHTGSYLQEKMCSTLTPPLQKGVGRL